MTVAVKRFTTSGMHCGSCSMLVDMTLNDLDGVVSSKTDHVSGITEVTYETGTVTPEGIIEAIRGAGYEAEAEE